MPDSLELRIGDLVFRDCEVYSADADLWLAGDTFSFELPGDTQGLRNGARVELWINGLREMTGVLERIRRKTTKQGRTLTLEGRDMLGLVVDSHVEEFVDLTGLSLERLASRLLRPLNWINRKEIVYERGIAAASPDDPERAPHADPGESVFEVLQRAAKARGLHFYSEPSGRLVFGKPRAVGPAEFRIIHKLDSAENNVVGSELDDNISKRYSKVVVVGQRDATDEDEVNILTTVEDRSFPFYKPRVVELPHDTTDAKAFGRLELAKLRAQGFGVTYTVSGFSASGKNWAVNRIVDVEDQFNDIRGDYLIYGRRFLRDKREGDRTLVRIGLKGVNQ